MPHFVGEI